MKFSLFVHMERYERETSYTTLFDQLTELVQLAEEGGFETAWIGEHHGMEFTISPNPFINIAYLANKTRRLRLGTGTVVAPFWHPIKLAGEAAITDIATGGRLDLGIARGAYSFEYQRLGNNMDAWEAGQRLREMIPVVQRLWAGDTAHEGEFWSFPTTACVPRPLQQPHPPIWVAARDPNSHDFAVANGCNVQVTPLWQGDEEVETLMGRFKDACAAHPERPRPRIMLLRHSYVGETGAEVDAAARAFSRFYCTFGAWFRNERPIREGFIEPLSDEEIAANEMFTPEKMRANNVVGTPDQVIARLKRYRDMGYDQYSFWIDTGMPHELKKKSLELFIREVMPAFA